MSAERQVVQISIDELVLNGFDERGCHEIVAGLQAELSHALSGWQPDGARIALPDIGSFTAPSGSATAVGRSVGQRIATVLRASASTGGGDL